MIVEIAASLPGIEYFWTYINPLPLCSPNGPWIAGGSVRRLLNDECFSDGDIDVFFADATQQSLWVHEMEKSGATILYTCSENRSWELNGRKVQEITIRNYKSLDDVLRSFDFTICQFGFDGTHILYPSIAMDHLRAKKLYLNKLTYAVNTVRRLVKYGKSGYEIPNETIISILNGVKEDPSTINISAPSGGNT